MLLWYMQFFFYDWTLFNGVSRLSANFSVFYRKEANLCLKEWKPEVHKCVLNIGPQTKFQRWITQAINREFCMKVAYLYL